MRTIAALVLSVIGFVTLGAVAPTPDTATSVAPLGLAGHYRSQATAATPAMVLHFVEVDVDGIDNAMYMELARADDPAVPFRQAIIQTYESNDQTVIRAWDLPNMVGLPGVTVDLAGAIAGLWAAPDAMPALSKDMLDANVDLVVEMQASGWVAETKHPFPTKLNGAVSMTSSVRMQGDTLVMKDTGLDANGSKLWGPDGDGYVFTRFEPKTTVTRMDGGLVLVQIVAPPADSPAHEPGGEIAVDYTGWTSSGFRFDTSRQEGRDPFRTRIPGQLIQGWNMGIPGMAVGERRKLVIPGDLGYGPNGNPRARIPGGETLIFDVSCLDLANPVARPNPAP